MCGIAGFYGFRDDNLIKKFSKELEHRGPDGEGLDLNDKASLLSRRLAIIDLKTGDQPIYNEDKSVVLVFNGEIYNYRDLRKKLEKKHDFKTNSDTETIVHGYEEWGEKIFNQLNGMFGLALYDKKKDKLIVARDHFGIKPIYYTQTGNKFIFSSEIKPMIDSGLVKKKANDRIIYRYLKFRIHDDRPETFFEGIYRLMPGELLTVEKGRVTKKYFSNLKQELLNAKVTNRLDPKRFKRELINAIALRLISDVPVGSALSGGLDSSTVVAAIDELIKHKNKDSKSVGKRQNTFSAVFPNSSNNEEVYIDELIKQRPKVEAHKVYPKPEKFFEEIEDFVRTQEEPTISTGPYAQFKVMEEAKKHVKVLLDGQGADEMMAGYLPYYFVYWKQLSKQGHYLKLLVEILSSWDVFSKYIGQAIKKKFGVAGDISLTALLNEQFVHKYKSEDFQTINDNLKGRLVEDIFHNSLPSLLRYEDKNSMRYSLEGRVPFLDFNLILYLFSLPDEAIIKGGWNKYILRQSVSDLLPEEIVRRRNKIGFTTPEEEWFNRMKNKIYEIFSSESFGKRKYFKQSEVLQAFQKYVEGKTKDTLLFWRFLNLELWLRVFFDEKKQETKKEKGYFEPNFKKKLEIKVGDKKYVRFPIKTSLFKKDDDYESHVKKYVSEFLNKLKKESKFKNLLDKRFHVFVSEKIVAIAQGRSYFIWDIKPGFWAKKLSKYVRRTPYGIGLGSPETMQLAIQEVGLPRVLFAAFVAVLTRPFYKGTFYHIVGRAVASIDGPTEYSVYPSNVSAKLGPKDPQKVAEQLGSLFKEKNFNGVVIIDANDIGQDTLGNSTDLDKKTVEKIFSDNPLGQGSEQTPIAVVFEV